MEIFLSYDKTYSQTASSKQRTGNEIQHWRFDLERNQIFSAAHHFLFSDGNLNFNI